MTGCGFSEASSRAPRCAASLMGGNIGVAMKVYLTMNADVPARGVGAARAAFRAAIPRPEPGTALHLRRTRLGELYDLGSRGSYAIFRETVSDGGEAASACGAGGRVPAAVHPVVPARRTGPFQRCCILTTPFWSGFPGFRVKLWMVDPVTKSYLGIYDWDGRDRAQSYLDALVRVLEPLSVPGSVWYELEATGFDAFLDAHRSGAET